MWCSVPFINGAACHIRSCPGRLGNHVEGERCHPWWLIMWPTFPAHPQPTPRLLKRDQRYPRRHVHRLPVVKSACSQRCFFMPLQTRSRFLLQSVFSLSSSSTNYYSHSLRHLVDHLVHYLLGDAACQAVCDIITSKSEFSREVFKVASQSSICPALSQQALKPEQPYR